MHEVLRMLVCMSSAWQVLQDIAADVWFEPQVEVMVIAHGLIICRCMAWPPACGP